MEALETLRLQAFKGQKVLASHLWTVPEDRPGLKRVEYLPEVQEEELEPEPVQELEPVEHLRQLDPLEILSTRILEDGQRIQELHRTILELVGSVSTHAAGATGPLVKLIDQLTGSVTETNANLSESLRARLADLDQRETVVLDAESEAETRLADVEAKKQEVTQESAVISGLVSQLAPQLLEQLGGSLAGGEDA